MYLAKFGYVDESGEILEIGAFVVEFPQSMMLRIIALHEGQ